MMWLLMFFQFGVYYVQNLTESNVGSQTWILVSINEVGVGVVRSDLGLLGLGCFDLVT